MCGRYLLNRNPRELAVLFPGMSIDDIPPEVLRPRYNIAPSQPAIVVHPSRSGPREAPRMRSMAWGFVADDPSAPRLRAQINARSESVFDKPTFRQAAIEGRCIVPASGWYEWSGKAPHRQPWVFRFDDDQPFGFAGIYSDPSQRADGDVAAAGFAILTMAANALAAPIHDRMPVVLYPAQFDEWLSRGTQSASSLLASREIPELITYSVSERVNSPRNDDVDCMQAARVPAQDDLFG